MRKRRTSDDEEGSEMEVDGEEKLEQNDTDSEEEEESESENEEIEKSAPQPLKQNPFLDSFYGLSSENPKERSSAANTMLQHCFFGPNANIKDAAYAFRRLLNGVCSGRAAARQGNASALASFLKVAFRLEKMEEVRTEAGSDDPEENPTLLAYVRARLIKATSPDQNIGKKKGSEERDYHFGKLFGILAVARSGILIPSDSSDIADITEVSSALISDLVELFWLKKWMREPAAHGVTTILKMFYDAKDEKHCSKIAQTLVEDVINPSLLTRGVDEVESSDIGSLLASFCAEQIGVVAFIQSQKRDQIDDLPFPLNQAVISCDTIPVIGQALSETSSVVHPRTHFVWDAIWVYLTSAQDPTEKGKSDKGPAKKVLSSRCPVGSDAPIDIIDAIIKVVVQAKLLRLEEDGPGKATHERKSLALCLVKMLAGATYVSSVSGPSQIVVDADALENVVLTPKIVRILFFDIVSTGNQKRNVSHLLKPLAMEILTSLIESCASQDDDSTDQRQLAFAKAFLNCEVRFDARTKTSTVSELLGFMGSLSDSPLKAKCDLWDRYMAYLEDKIFTLSSKLKDEDSATQTNGYVELLYSTAKNILRQETDNEKEKSVLADYQETSIKRILNIFLVAAFFNCENLKRVDKSPGKKKGKANKATVDPILAIGLKVKASSNDGTGLNYSVRSIMSLRFFSLLSDFVNHVTHHLDEDASGKTAKDAAALSVLVDFTGTWAHLEACGGDMFNKSSENDSEGQDPVEAVKTILQKEKEAEKALVNDSSDPVKESRKRFCTGAAVLAYTLNLHRLTCGADAEVENEDPDADEEDDEEGIRNALEGLQAIVEDFSCGTQRTDINPLFGLAELCANVLSSPLGSGNIGRGASPKLVREATKFVWLGGLRLSSAMASEEHTLLDKDVVGVLLNAIGVSSDEVMGEEESEGEESDEADENDESDADENVFSKASDLLDDGDTDMKQAEPEDESDIELDPDNLKSLLEEGSDADIDDDILEHHSGADPALARLIKMKQEARKAGQQAKEKVEIGHQLRCTLLIELMVGRTDGWNRLFRSDVILQMVLPILNLRKKVEKMAQKSLDGAAKTGAGEKKALLERLTSLLKQKLCKLRLTSMPLSGSIDVEQASTIANDIVEEAKRSSSKEHSSCCGSCVVFVLRSIPSAPDAILVSKVFDDAVGEWATKRTTHLGTTLFDEFITHAPILAQAVLGGPLLQASQNARSTFLKSESFRLLTSLFSSKEDPETSELAAAAAREIEGLQEKVVSAVETALHDDEMLKAKRVLPVVKLWEKFLHHLSAPCSSDTISGLERVKKLLIALGGSESNAVKSAVTKLAEQMDSKIDELKTSSTTKKVEPEPESSNAQSAKSKKKKKKKKKK